MSSDGQARDATERPVRVLVIDDSEVFQAACRDLLRCIPSFVEVGQAATGEDGVSMAQALHPDLVVVDIVLPGIDGLETCRRLRSMTPAPLVRAVLGRRRSAAAQPERAVQRLALRQQSPLPPRSCSTSGAAVDPRHRQAVLFVNARRSMLRPARNAHTTFQRRFVTCPLAQ
jgi:CheY-like chemotaxis protein